MIEDSRTRPPETPRWSEPLPGGPGAIEWRPPPPLHRFLGGAPLLVFLRLLVVSLIVGVILMWLNLHPIDVFRAVQHFADRMWALGFDAVRDFADYILAGAIIVVPVWLVLRLLSMRSVP
jgi:hypothetical protein